MPELAKVYNPQEHEDRINQAWLDSGYFNPDNLKLAEDAPAYTIILPPPNITDRLHLGHASVLAIEDLLIRFHRMSGYRTLWLPGTDHAAIATQNVVERKIYKEEGKTRHDFSRADFFKRVYDFALETQATILGQFKGFGASLDWSRLAFTLDEPRRKAVQKMFIDMYDAGAIYRGERIVNWCPRCQSTLADDEVEYKEEKTALYTFKYWKDFPVAISTTRPETKLGDTAVAVNPKDERYTQYIGREFSGDFCGQPLTIKIIADREVDMDFGTGALGVTPAHSAIDWRMAELNNLPIVKVIDEAGNIRPGFAAYSGLSAAAARAEVVKVLAERGLIEKEEEIMHNVSVCYRCDTVIEPLPSQQWFVSVDAPLARLDGKSLKQAALEASESLNVSFVTERFKKRYEDWMKNLRDWCISRQIIFGHPIPVWYRHEEIVVSVDKPEGEGWTQDPDTLDTWFSSGMWTFSTLGWPDTFKDGVKTGDLATYHPTAVMETGYDIITLWVSRMIMMSLFAVGEIPFKNVYLHGMVLDKHGKKMSKSKGNGIDPTVVGKEYGTDAVRLALLIGNTPGVDVRLSEEKIASFRNFTNKLWNISRFIISEESQSGALAEPALADRWIMSRLQRVISEVSAKIKAYDLSGAGDVLRTFTVDEVADWYLEAGKFDGSTAGATVRKKLLETLLKLWHPFMPFVTETIWQELKPGEDMLLVAPWPLSDESLINEVAESDFARLQGLITAIRNLRSEHRIEPARKLAAHIRAGEHAGLISASISLLEGLRTGLAEIHVDSSDIPAGALFASHAGVDIYLDAPVDAASERARLEKELAYLNNGVRAIEKKLANADFVANAPASLVAAEKEKLAGYQTEQSKLEVQLRSLA